MKRRDMLRLTTGLALSFPAITKSFAQQAPIRLVVPFPPGGAADMLARMMERELTTELGGRTGVVDYRGGSGGMIGTASVARAAPDGNTVGIIGVGPLCASPFLFKKMLYDPIKDLQPITQLIDSPLLCVVNAEHAQSYGWDTFESLMKWAKNNPGQFMFGSGGVGGAGHLNFTAICKHLNIDAMHVPYKGGGPLITDLRAGRIHSCFDAAGAVQAYVKEGDFKALAVSRPTRFPLLPDVPGLAEFPSLNLQHYSLNGWHALMAPAGLPQNEITTLNTAVQNVLSSKIFQKNIESLIYTPAENSGPQALAELIKEDTKKFKSLVEMAGVQPS